MPQRIKSLYELLADEFPDEQSAIDRLRAIRWRNGAFCPYCRSERVMHFADKRTHKCAECRKRFSIKVGSIFEDSKIPLRKWFAAIWMITNNRKGVASTQLARDLHLTQKSAWFVLHRLRHAAKTKSFERPLSGVIEIDESFFGGKDHNKHKSKRPGVRGASTKTAVFGLLERGGRIRAGTIPNLTGRMVRGRVFDNVAPGSALMSDEMGAAKTFPPNYPIWSVNHAKGEYVRYAVHINTLEGAWGLFKRQIYGVHHHVSTKHLDAYLCEMCYRYSRRDMDVGERVDDLLSRVEGRLTYKALTDGGQKV